MSGPVAHKLNAYIFEGLARAEAEDRCPAGVFTQGHHWRGGFVAGALWAAAQSGEQSAADPGDSLQDEREALAALIDSHADWNNPTWHRHAADAVLAHLAAHRAAPTTTEWGVRYEADRDLVLYEARDSEAIARAEAAESPTDTAVVVRQVSDWMEAGRG